MLGIYSTDSVYDNTEYHAVRNGVNQNEIMRTLRNKGFDCTLKEYCSLKVISGSQSGKKGG